MPKRPPKPPPAKPSPDGEADGLDDDVVGAVWTVNGPGRDVCWGDVVELVKAGASVTGREDKPLVRFVRRHEDGLTVLHEVVVIARDVTRFVSRLKRLLGGS